MFRYRTSQYLGVLLFALTFQLISYSASANCGNCPAPTCSVDSATQKAFEAKRTTLRESHYPERLIQLMYRLSPRCATCINNMETKFKLMYIKNDNKVVRQWSPPLERWARKELKANRIESFYILLNNGRKCTCCDTGSYEDFDDYDEDLGLNTNGPLLAFETPESVGHEGENHYSRPIKPYPPVREFKEPKSPRIIHTTCKNCQNAEDAYNNANFNEYGYEMEYYHAQKEVDLGSRVLAGLHNHKRDIYLDTSLSETAFFLKVNEITERIDEWKQYFKAQSNYMVYVRKEMDALKSEIPQRKAALENCEKAPSCEKRKPIVEDPRPSERIACNEAEPQEEPYVFDDLNSIHQYLDRSLPRYIDCKNNFNCPKMKCSDIRKIRDLSLETEQRLKESKKWADDFRSKALKHWTALKELSIESQTQKGKTEFAQAVQGSLHSLSSATLAIWDLNRSFKDIGNSPTSTDPAVNLARRNKVLEKLATADKVFEDGATALGLLNTLTSDVQFPFVEGTGVPGLRVLNKLSVSLGFCLKSVASEIKGLIENVKGNKPQWKGNVLAFAVKGLQCYSILQQMERAEIINQLQKDLDAEEIALKGSFRTYSCLAARGNLIDDAIEKFKDVTPKMYECVGGACGRGEVPPPVSFDPPLDGYGRALKYYEAMIQELGSRIHGKYSLLEFEESPAPTLALDKPRYLPSEAMEAKYEVPWCIADAGWMGFVPSDTPHGPRSIADHGQLAHLSLRGTWEGVFDFRSPANSGDYDLRLYDNGQDGKELKYVPFKTSSDLGLPIGTQPFSKEFRRPLASQYIPPEMNGDNLEAGKGRVYFIALDAANLIRGSHINIYSGEKHIYGGWAQHLDLPSGTYSVEFTSYIPARTMQVTFTAGQVHSVYIGGDARLKVYTEDALGKTIGSHINVYRSSDKKHMYGGWAQLLDLPPDTYDVELTSYLPHIKHRSVTLKKMEQSTLRAGGYSRITLKAFNALKKEMDSHINVYRSSDRFHLYGGWAKQLDLPPDTYDVEFTSYVPFIKIAGVTTTAGLISPIEVGGYGRFNVKATDALGQDMDCHVNVYRSSDRFHLYGGWAKQLDIPPGFYDIEFTSYIPYIKYTQVEIYKNRARLLQPGGYGRIIVNSQTDQHFNVEDANGNVLYGGWEKQIDIAPGNYKVTFTSFEPDKVINIQVRKGKVVNINL